MKKRIYNDCLRELGNNKENINLFINLNVQLINNRTAFGGEFNNDFRGDFNIDVDFNFNGGVKSKFKYN